MKYFLKRREYIFLGIFFILILFFCIGFLLWSVLPPKDFPIKQSILIEQGSSARVVVHKLKELHIVRSESIAMLALEATRNTNNIITGEYQFESPLPLFRVIQRITNGQYGSGRLRITIPEGYDNQAIGILLASKIKGFALPQFLSEAKPFEGYLFPDTYFVFEGTATPNYLISLMRKNFDRQTRLTGQYPDKISQETIIIASILEREAVNPEDGKVIAGIIQNRLKKRMPLQIDATLTYLLGKGSSELTKSDLKFDSPYNTYTNYGLPPGPIGNPGIEMIQSAQKPTPSDYLYYLHDKNGFPHYAETYAEHLSNKRTYLK